MKKFYCKCGGEIFFENRLCESCGRFVGFDVETMSLLALAPHGEVNYRSSCGRIFRKCGNWTDFDTCNWLVPEKSNHRLCFGCQFNRTIPNQTNTGSAPQINLFRWSRLEDAKKRLLYTLLTLGIPLKNGWESPDGGLLFDFLENIAIDGSDEIQTVTTGYANGIITINILEADDVARGQAKSNLNERQRTVLGHFRHEVGHYCWEKIFSHLPLAEYFGEVFGEPKLSYQASLNSYYENGPPNNWHDAYISAYASSHPSEDWAETWNHYLLIYECLETAYELGLVNESPSSTDIFGILSRWQDLAVTMNQLSRSIGVNDAYPFIITSRIKEKLNYVSSLIESFKKRTLQEIDSLA